MKATKVFPSPISAHELIVVVSDVKKSLSKPTYNLRAIRITSQMYLLIHHKSSAISSKALRMNIGDNIIVLKRKKTCQLFPILYIKHLHHQIHYYYYIKFINILWWLDLQRCILKREFIFLKNIFDPHDPMIESHQERMKYERLHVTQR